MFQAWQVDFIRSKVDEMKGDLGIRIYASSTTYKVWYNPNDDVALLGKVTWDEQSNRERLSKAWPDEVLRAMNAQATRIHIQYRSNEKKSEWFGPDKNMRPIQEIYDYITTFKRHDEDPALRVHPSQSPAK
jgi:hypothetical protein